MNACPGTQANFYCGLLEMSDMRREGGYEDALYYRLQGVLRTDFILTRLGVLLMCIHPVKR